MKLVHVLIPMVAVGLIWSGCESDSGGQAGDRDPLAGQTFQKAVTAAEGGMLATETGSASVVVPAGALAQDTTLTLKVEDPAGAAMSSIYDFGPDGTQFLKPVTVKIQFTGATGKDQRAALAWQDGSTWREIPGSSASGGFVLGSIDHFTKFTIIFVEDKVVVTGDCADVAKNFSACGGDLKGKWAFDTVCFDDQMLGENPFSEQCPDAKVEIDGEWRGTINFDGTNATTQYEGQTFKLTFDIPMSCLPDVASCDGLFGEESTCAAKSDRCVCTQINEEGAGEPETRPYRVEGNTLVIEQDDGDDRLPYCISGDTVVVETTTQDDEEDGGEIRKFYMVLKRM